MFFFLMYETDTINETYQYQRFQPLFRKGKIPLYKHRVSYYPYWASGSGNTEKTPTTGQLRRKTRDTFFENNFSNVSILNTSPSISVLGITANFHWK